MASKSIAAGKTAAARKSKSAKKTSTPKSEVYEKISELAILADALKDWGDRMAGTFWQEGDSDIGRFPILIAARVDAIAGEIEASLDKNAATGGAK